MTFQADQVQKALDSKAERVSGADVARISELRSVVEEKIATFPDAQREAREQAALLLDFLGPRVSAPLSAETRQAAGALLYLSAPVDLVPDHEPGGFDDDAAVLALATGRIRAALRTFCASSGRVTPSWLDD